MKIRPVAIALLSLMALQSARAGEAASVTEKLTLRNEDVRSVAPALQAYTQGRLLGDVWKRSDLAPRDRSLVTISALIANGQTAQLTPHLSKAMDNGLTQAQAAEVITHLAFYVGWPNVFSAMPVAKDVFEKRPY